MGRIFAREWDLAKAYAASIGSNLQFAESFNIAAKQAVDRRIVRLAKEEA